MKKPLPLGRQDFAMLIKAGCLYVDKTRHIHRLLRSKYYFMARPRCFGKSLLLSTMEEMFLGNRGCSKVYGFTTTTIGQKNIR